MRCILLGPLTQATVHQTHQRTVPRPVSPATSPCGSRTSGTFGLVLRYFAEMPGALGVSVASPPHGRPTPRPPYLLEASDQPSMSLVFSVALVPCAARRAFRNVW